MGTRFSGIRLISFDLDDTLVATRATIEPRVRQTAAMARQQMGLRLSAAAEEAAVTSLLTVEPDVRWDALIAAFGLDPASEAALRVREAYASSASDFLNAMKGASEVLAELSSRFLVGVLTNGAKRTQREKLRRLGLDRWVNLVLTSDEVGAHKPAATGFHALCRQLGVEPGEAIHVGDSPINDIVAAQAAGFAGAVWLRSSEPHPEPDGPWRADAAIDRLADLLGLV